MASTDPSLSIATALADMTWVWLRRAKGVTHLFTGVGLMLAAVSIASCSNSGATGATFKAVVTSVVPYGSYTVGVGFNVHNVGSAGGDPYCTVVIGPGSSNAASGGVQLAWIEPNGWESQMADLDTVYTGQQTATQVVENNDIIAVTCETE